jgi:hypothetical protein
MISLHVVSGDIICRVGVLKAGDDPWHGVIGMHEIAERNLAGEELLQLCTAKEPTVMNT